MSLLASKTASGRTSWRPRWLRTGLLPAKTVPGEPPGVQDGLWTGLLALKTAQNGSLIAKHSLWMRFLALDMFALLPVSLCLHDSSLDETSGISTWLPINFAACSLACVALCDGVTLVMEYFPTRAAGSRILRLFNIAKN